MLIASITARRTGRMGDVVATIQAEQDRVIRAGLQGVLVVQGGPGTGKTVAALHRAAYLLYTHRRTLEAAACWSSARTLPSSATSARSCRPWARPTWCSPRSPSYFRGQGRPG